MSFPNPNLNTGFGMSQPQPLRFGVAAPSTFQFGQGQNQSLFSTQPTQNIFGSNSVTRPSIFATPQNQLFGLPGTQTGTGHFGTFNQQQPNSSIFPPQAKTSVFQMTPAFNASCPFEQQIVQQQQQQQIQPEIDENVEFYQSIFQCNQFGDERDITLANFNYIQACWGRGRGFYSQRLPPVIYTPGNPLCRFKAVGYSFMFTDSNEDGQVILTVKKSPQQIQAGETRMIAAFQSISNQQNILFKINAIKASGEYSTVIIMALDQTTNRRIPACELHAGLAQPHIKSLLDSLDIISVCPKVKPSQEQLKQYLERAPNGVNHIVWIQAQKDNPDPSSMIPVAIVGIDALKKKALWQESENEQHKARIELMRVELSDLKARYKTMEIGLLEYKRRQYQMNHRLLKVIGILDRSRKDDLPLDVNELELKKGFAKMQKDITSPQNYQGKISDTLNIIVVQRGNLMSKPQLRKLRLDSFDLPEIGNLLSVQNDSVKLLIGTIQTDVLNLKRVRGGIDELQCKVLQQKFSSKK